MSVLAVAQILGLFTNTLIANNGLSTNTLTADDEYSLFNKENLLQPIQMQLSKKPKSFPHFFASYLKSIWKFKHFEEKD